jgi:hypothetical protein
VLQPQPWAYNQGKKHHIKCIHKPTTIRNELVWMERDQPPPPRCRKSLGIKGKHPYLIPMVNSLIWELGFVSNPKCLNNDFKG